MDLLVFFLLYFVSLKGHKIKGVSYYENLINESNRNAWSYQTPTNANNFFSSGKHEKFGTYDFVVIGAGAAGTVIANRLSDVLVWTVLVLEAGKHGDDLCDIPGMSSSVLFTDFNWAYNSTPQKYGCLGNVDKSCTYSRGRGLGGSTLINGLVYMRGYKNDFDIWAKLAGNKRWGYKTVFDYFKKSENFVPTNPDAPYDVNFHGTNGPLQVEYHSPMSSHLSTFLKANKELGFEIVDYNANKIGASVVQHNVKHGRRFDGGKAFLDPVQNRSNLDILKESYVTKILVDNMRKVATGVEFSYKSKSYFVETRKEVILSAGAFGSPQILMLSGIGPKKHLKKLKIEVVEDLEVGSTFRDHIGYYGISINSNYTETNEPLETQIKEFLNGVGYLTVPFNTQGIGTYESSFTKGTGVPDIELLFMPPNSSSTLFSRIYGLSDEIKEYLSKDTNPSQVCNMFIINLHPVSKGTFRLKSSNPYDYPLIDLNPLSDRKNKDIKILYEGIKIVLKLLDTKPFKSINATLNGGSLKTCNHHKYLSKRYWYCVIRYMTLSHYHPVATCPMGTHSRMGAVVDSELRVFGFKNLRVADASVIPINLACHTNAPSVMIGEQLGDIVKKTYNII